MEGFILQAIIYLFAAVIAVSLSNRFGLGSVLGYIVAGVVIGPVLGLVGSEAETIHHVAEFGVVMMLFLIGLELEPSVLWTMRKKVIGLGGMQIVITTFAIAGMFYMLGQPINISLAIGMIFSLSSTAIVLQTLSEKNLLQSESGRSVLSVLLAQDIAVVPVLILLPLLALGSAEPFGGVELSEGQSVTSFVQSLPAWGVTLVVGGAICTVIAFGVYGAPQLFQFIHVGRLRELYTVASLAIVTGISGLMILVGLPPALGTFLAGVVLANSAFRHELEANIAPFKGLFMGLFFVTVGIGINFTLIFEEPIKIFGYTLAVIVCKMAVLFMIALAFRMKGRDQLLFTLSLAQAGEFGLLLLSFVGGQNFIPIKLLQSLSIVIALSMFLTPLLFVFFDRLSARFYGAKPGQESDEISPDGNVIIAGVGRFGQVVNKLVQSAGYNTTVIDHDLEVVKLLRRFGVKSFFGDPTRPDLLNAAGIENARVLVVSLDDKEAALRLVSYVRRTYPDLYIVARARDRNEVYRLFNAGATQIVREAFYSSARAGRYALEGLGFSELSAQEHVKAFVNKDRHNIFELATLWDPKIPIPENTAFLERSKELSAEMETSLMARLQNQDDDVGEASKIGDVGEAIGGTAEKV